MKKLFLATSVVAALAALTLAFVPPAQAISPLKCEAWGPAEVRQTLLTCVPQTIHDMWTLRSCPEGKFCIETFAGDEYKGTWTREGDSPLIIGRVKTTNGTITLMLVEKECCGERYLVLTGCTILEGDAYGSCSKATFSDFEWAP